jgi:hypothetical protein
MQEGGGCKGQGGEKEDGEAIKDSGEEEEDELEEGGIKENRWGQDKCREQQRDDGQQERWQR